MKIQAPLTRKFDNGWVYSETSLETLNDTVVVTAPNGFVIKLTGSNYQISVLQEFIEAISSKFISLHDGTTLYYSPVGGWLHLHDTDTWVNGGFERQAPLFRVKDLTAVIVQYITDKMERLEDARR